MTGKAKPASLISAGLVQTKGAAKPAAADARTPALTPAPKASFKADATGYYKALTVKLDEKRYKELKAAGLANDKSSQDIFVEALDAWLSANS